jgi:hypothetical protein
MNLPHEYIGQQNGSLFSQNVMVFAVASSGNILTDGMRKGGGVARRSWHP